MSEESMTDTEDIELQRVSWWRLLLPDIELFLIKAVRLPSLGLYGKEIIEIDFYNTISDNINATLLSWCNNANSNSLAIDATLEWMHNEDVTESWKMKLKPTMLSFSNLDYRSAGEPFITTLSARCTNIEIVYPDKKVS
jgi:hypothetical protein